MTKMRRYSDLAGALIVSLGAIVASAEEPSLQSLIAFGTTCARCHEGECSGRLSFDTGAAGAAGHIRRYAEGLPDTAVPELFQLLEKMKRECAYSPLPVPVPRDGVWSSEALSKLRTHSRHAYLVPLGSLERGTYRVELRIPERKHIHVEVLTRDFELLLEEPLVLRDGMATIAFTAQEPRDSLLRLRGREPILLERITLRRQPPSRREGGDR